MYQLIQTQIGYKRTGFSDESETGIEKVLDSEWYTTITAIQAVIITSTLNFFNSLGFIPVLLPITTASVSSPMGKGSDSLPVKVNLLGKETYLADSMQFQLEFILRQQRERKGVFYIMPSFRGEDPDPRHLNQFFHSEVECAGEWLDVKKLAIDYIKEITNAILKDQELRKKIWLTAGSTKHLEKLVTAVSIPSITFDEAVELLENDPLYVNNGEVRSLSSRGEQKLIELYDSPLWVTHFDANSVPFYQASITRKNGIKQALCGDLLMGIGETIGAGQRHSTKQELLLSMSEHEINVKDYYWYLDMKEKRRMTTSGFGLGIERYILWVLRHHDIRDIPMFSRLKGFVENSP